MNFTIKMSNAEVDKIFDIANSASKKEVGEMMNTLKSGATYDFGGIAISHPENNIFEVSFNPHFSNFILSGPIMDIISIIPAIQTLAKGISEHVRSPILVEYDSFINNQEVYTGNYDEDDFDYDTDDSDVSELNDKYSNTEINSENKLKTDSIKPKHEYAIFNV